MKLTFASRDRTPPPWQNRAHFFGISAHVMRQILVEYARRHAAEKGGGGACKLALDDSLELAGKVDVGLIALDGALERMTELDAQQSRIIELRFFCRPYDQGYFRSDGYLPCHGETRLAVGPRVAPSSDAQSPVE